MAMRESWRSGRGAASPRQRSCIDERFNGSPVSARTADLTTTEEVAVVVSVVTEAEGAADVAADVPVQL
jgi:hypothetical protein